MLTTVLGHLQPPGAARHGRRPELLRWLARLTPGTAFPATICVISLSFEDDSG